MEKSFIKKETSTLVLEHWSKTTVHVDDHLTFFLLSSSQGMYFSRVCPYNGFSEIPLLHSHFNSSSTLLPLFLADGHLAQFIRDKVLHCLSCLS